MPVDNVDQLIDMPFDTVVRDSRSVVWVRVPSSDRHVHWKGTNGAIAHSMRLLDHGPVDVLYHPYEPPAELIESGPPMFDIQFQVPWGNNFVRPMMGLPRRGEVVFEADGRDRRVIDVYWEKDGTPVVTLDGNDPS